MAVERTLPDRTKRVGLTEAWRIGWPANGHIARWVPTAGTPPTGRGTCTRARRCRWRDKGDLTPSPHPDEIIAEPFRVDAEGQPPIPTKPGPGVESDREAMRRFGVRLALRGPG